MVRHVEPQTKRFFASVLTTYLSILFALYIAVVTADLSNQFALVLGVAALVVAVVAEYYLTYGPLMQYRERQLSTFFDDFLGLVEQDVERQADGDVEVRANIMRPTSDGLFDDPTYSIAYWHDDRDYTAAEFDLEFEIGQGCVGQTHEKGQQMFAISPDHADSWDESWNTTNVQDEVAGHLDTIIGTPIYRPSDTEQNDPVAVLIVDSEQDFEEFVALDADETLADITFKQTAVAERAIDHARNVGVLL